jgi:hypothetical protein
MQHPCEPLAVQYRLASSPAEPPISRHFQPDRHGPATAHLPPRIYAHGVSRVRLRLGKKRLAARGRIPFVLYPILCGRCGMLWPEFFRVPDAEWQHYIQPGGYYHPCGTNGTWSCVNPVTTPSVWVLTVPRSAAARIRRADLQVTRHQDGGLPRRGAGPYRGRSCVPPASALSRGSPAPGRPHSTLPTTPVTPIPHRRQHRRRSILFGWLLQKRNTEIPQSELPLFKL